MNNVATLHFFHIEHIAGPLRHVLDIFHSDIGADSTDKLTTEIHAFLLTVRRATFRPVGV